jgi:hypothetical protein
MRTVKWIVIVIGILFVVAQAIRPAMTNPVVDQSRTIEARTQMPPDIAAILERSCGDCHTGATRWPWYSQISPVSWYVVRRRPGRVILHYRIQAGLTRNEHK